ncbi:FixH family protein [Paenibacillus sp. Marseille-Q4541]|uniref:FixH family protein n=1 Tax=Paenibacillus sp. Marseille-Q4541 TaxID=2831522 RepID=UPI001BA680BB|nr:FixH family protein [Paenibacillus sp. Marseille-Q4541]
MRAEFYGALYSFSRRSAILVFSTLLALLLMSGCQKDGNAVVESALLEPIKVELVVPEGDSGVEVSDVVRLEAIVTQQDAYIDDADEVKFEISLEGTSGLEVESEYDGEGKYIAEYQFPTAGVYKITSHVTARGMHSMPSKQLEVIGK